MPLDKYEHANGFWYVRGTVTIWKDGRVRTVGVHRSTRTRDEDQAEGIRRQIENEVAERNISGREPALTFQQAAARYVKQGGEKRFLDKPIAHLGTIRIDQITQQDLDDAAFKAYPVAATATRRRQFYAPTLAILRGNGVDKRYDRPPDAQKRTVFFRPSQADQAIREISKSRYPNPWTPALATFLFTQGSRVGETLQIDGKDDISLEGRYAIIRHTKSGKERMIPLYRRTIAALSTIPNLGQNGPLFLRYDGRPFAEREARGYSFTWWDRAITQIGLDPSVMTPHTARHSWATWFYATTKDVVRLKAEGGWDSGEWQRYVKLAAPALATEAKRAGFDFTENASETDSAEFPQSRGAV